MAEESHKSGLYKWKRQEEPRVYSRSQNVKSNDEIQNWIKKVEEASNRAAEQVFGVTHSSGRARGRAAAQATHEHARVHEEAYTEAKDLLSQWMDDKVNLNSDQLEIDAQYDDDSWQRYGVESDVKKEWDNLLANNYEEYGLPLSSRPEKNPSFDPYNMNEDDAVASVMHNMMEKQVVKNEFKKDLGLDPYAKQKDPRNKMELRHQQVKENREKRERELEKRRRELMNKKEAIHGAKRMVLKEERDKEMSVRREEMEIRKEMGKIRKEMQEDRRKMKEEKEKDQEAKEEALLAAKVQVAWEEESEVQVRQEQGRAEEDRRRQLQHRLQEVELRQAANNLKILQRHFSAWYNVVLERRLQMGKARAISDWKLLLRAWNAWKRFVRERKSDKESKQYERDVIDTHRKGQIAERHSRVTLLRKYFVAWQVWVRSEQERRELKNAQSNTRNKMMSLLEAAASGKLWNQEKAEEGGGKQSARGHKGQQLKSARNSSREMPSTADKIDAMFQNTRKLPSSRDSVSTCNTDRSDAPPPSHHHLPQSRLPSEPWQVTRRHLDLTPQEMAELGGVDPDNRPGDMNAKVLKRFGKQPWHKPEVSSYEHRHLAQKKILAEQKRQIKEQKRLIEDLQFDSTHSDLQKQLAEQKLTLQQLVDNSAKQNAESAKQNGKSEKDNGGSPTTEMPSSKPPSKRSIQKPSNQNRATSAPVAGSKHMDGNRNNNNSAGPMRGQDTGRSGASTNRTGGPVSARTDASRTTYTSTASEKSKYLQVLKNMEERTAERARIKAEREEKRKKTEDEKLAILEAEEQARLQEMEEEKRKRVESYRERKRQEKQREAERLLQEEKLRLQNQMADEHYQKSILKYRGLYPFKKLVALAKEQEQTAVDHYEGCLCRKVLLAWHEHVRREWREREQMADQFQNFVLIKHAFQSWRLFKHHSLIQEHKAVHHFNCVMKAKVFRTWRDYANEEKVASWEKDRKAREHFKRSLLRRTFTAWRKLPEEIIREKQRETRRRELREKVAAMLPDFDVSNSVDQSTNFSVDLL